MSLSLIFSVFEGKNKRPREKMGISISFKRTWSYRSGNLRNARLICIGKFPSKLVRGTLLLIKLAGEKNLVVKTTFLN